MRKSLIKWALVAGAAGLFFALTWLANVDQRSPKAALRLLFLGIVIVAGGAMLLWSTIVGSLSRTRMWSPQWTFLGGAIPFYLLAVWVFFFSGLEMQSPGYARMLVLIVFGSASGRLARKKAFAQFSEEDSPSTPLPPPTLFPK